MISAQTPADNAISPLDDKRNDESDISLDDIYHEIRHQDQKYWVDLVTTRSRDNDLLQWMLFRLLGGLADVTHANEICEGSRIFGRYWLQEKLGKGGTATVWRAFDQVLDRPVAIKLCTEPDERRRRRILQEARDSGQITHENVIRIYESCENSDMEMAGIVMELCAEAKDEHTLDVGCDLATMIRNSEQSKEYEYDEAQAVQWTLEIALGVRAAHRAHIYSRDIKPSNVLVKRKNKTAQVVDFGLSPINRNAKPAHVGDDSAPRQTITMTTGHNQIVVGTPAYMAPEQARGMPDPDRYDPDDRQKLIWLDVYGIGACLFELLTKKAPHEVGPGKTVEATLEAARANDIRWERLSDSSRLKRVVQKAMATNPADRYGSVGDLIADLSCFLANQPMSHERWRWSLRTRLAIKRNPFSAALGVINAVAVLVLLVLVTNIATARKDLSVLRQQKDEADQQAAAATEKAAAADEKAKASEEKAAAADEKAKAAKDEARRFNAATQQCITEKVYVATRFEAEHRTAANLSVANRDLSAVNERNMDLCSGRVSQLNKKVAELERDLVVCNKEVSELESQPKIPSLRESNAILQHFLSKREKVTAPHAIASDNGVDPTKQKEGSRPKVNLDGYLKIINDPDFIKQVTQAIQGVTAGPKPSKTGPNAGEMPSNPSQVTTDPR